MKATLINMGGEERPVLFGNLAFQHLLKKQADSPEELGDEAKLYLLVHGGLLCGYFSKGKKVDFTFSDVVEWLDNLPTETYTTITNMIYETTFYKSVISDYVGVHTIDNAETDAKKK